MICSSKPKVPMPPPSAAGVSRINGRPVLQPTYNCSNTPSPRPASLDKLSSLPVPVPGLDQSPISRSPRPPAVKRPSDTKAASPPKIKTPSLDRKKSKSFNCTYSSSLILDSPGSIAAVRREHMALQQAQRKLKISHYGRSKPAKFDIDDHQPTISASASNKQEKRCTFITPNSDPIYVAYHDQEWGVPVHDDNMLFELLVLSGAQVGSDWTSILKKRQVYRDAFSGFNPEIIAKWTDKQMTSIATRYGIEISRVRGVVDNSIRILEVKREFGSFSKYMWGFVNDKPICPDYKFGHKMAVKTSKSESISKDMVRRGFRFVGPTVLHSFMQAAGLTNDHLITCFRHSECSNLTQV